MHRLWLVRTTHRLLLLEIGCIFLLNGNSAAQPASKLYAWYVESNNVEVPLQHVSEYHPNAFFIQFIPGPDQPGGSWPTILEDLSLHDRYTKVAKMGTAREQAEKLRTYFRGLIARAKLKSVDIYLMTGELVYPENLFEQYPGMRDPDRDALWKFLGDRAEEVLAVLPDLGGFVIYLDEVPHKIYELQGGQPVESCITRLLSTYLRICAARNKRLLVSTFTNYYPMRLEALLRAIRRIPPSDHFAVLNWICPSDWGLFPVVNPAIGRVGGHPEVLNFDFSGENWGEGLLPLGQLDLVADRLRNAFARGAHVAGLSGFINWWIPQNVFGTPNEVNLFGAPRLLQNPEKDPAELYGEWLTLRYGKGVVPLLLPAFRNSFRVVTASRQISGFWAMEWPKSEFAPAHWIDFSLRADSPAVWDENFRSVEAGLLNPDERALADVLREKDNAVADAQAAVEAVESAQQFLPGSEYDALSRCFTRARDEARALRPYFELYFRYKMWAKDHEPSRLARMRELQQHLRNWADYFEQRYPPDPLHNALRIREYVDQVDGLLAGKPLPQVVITW